MVKFQKPNIQNRDILNTKVGDPDGFVSNDGMWAAIPWTGDKKGFCIIHNGKQVHDAKTYKQALAYIKKMSKVQRSTSSTLEEFL